MNGVLVFQLAVFAKVLKLEKAAISKAFLFSYVKKTLTTFSFFQFSERNETWNKLSNSGITKLLHLFPVISSF